MDGERRRGHDNRQGTHTPTLSEVQHGEPRNRSGLVETYRRLLRRPSTVARQPLCRPSRVLSLRALFVILSRPSVLPRNGDEKLMSNQPGRRSEWMEISGESNYRQGLVEVEKDVSRNGNERYNQDSYQLKRMSFRDHQ